MVACGWSVVPLDHDEERWDRCTGVFGTLDAELEVQRTIQRAEFTAFLCFFGELLVQRRRTLTTKALLMGKQQTPIRGSQFGKN